MHCTHVLTSHLVIHDLTPAFWQADNKRAEKKTACEAYQGRLKVSTCLIHEVSDRLLRFAQAGSQPYG